MVDHEHLVGIVAGVLFPGWIWLGGPRTAGMSRRCLWITPALDGHELGGLPGQRAALAPGAPFRRGAGVSTRMGKIVMVVK